jgi:hypothetical protein
VKLEGEYKCTFCDTEFSWYYIAPQWRNASVLDVETIPEDKIGLYQIIESVEKNGYKYPVSATVYCPKCDRLNKIDKI